LGQIKSQTIKGSIYSYLGVLLGFTISGLLLPRLLSTEENGLIKLLVSYSTLFAQFGTLGFNNATTRLFAYFRNSSNNHHGFLALTLLVMLAGFLLTMVLFYILKGYLISQSEGSAEILIQYIGLLLPFSFFTLLFLTLDTYLKVLFDTVTGTFYREFVQRVLILVSIAAFYFNIIPLNSFIVAYIASCSLPGVLLLVRLITTKQFSLKTDWGFIDKSMAKELFNMSFYGVIVGFSGIMIFNVDSIIISRMLGIEATGIYAITFFFSTLIIIPSRSLRKISGTIIAEAWRNGDMRTIGDVYRKSSINQMIFASLLFIGLWGNIHNILWILPPEYAAGKYVILFIGLTNLIEMTFGISNVILSTSVHYRFTAYLNIVLALLIIGFNILFINLFGITGAAMASTASFIIINILRSAFIYFKFRMQPFTLTHLYVFILGGATYSLSLVIPNLESNILDILLRSSFIATIFSCGVYLLNLSDELSLVVNKGIDRIKERIG
jgi:O-antigen/teichoic acid export membrane protein